MTIALPIYSDQYFKKNPPNLLKYLFTIFPVTKWHLNNTSFIYVTSFSSIPYYSNMRLISEIYTSQFNHCTQELLKNSTTVHWIIQITNQIFVINFNSFWWTNARNTYNVCRCHGFCHIHLVMFVVVMIWSSWFAKVNNPHIYSIVNFILPSPAMISLLFFFWRTSLDLTFNLK